MSLKLGPQLHFMGRNCVSARATIAQLDIEVKGKVFLVTNSEQTHKLFRQRRNPCTNLVWEPKNLDNKQQILAIPHPSLHFNILDSWHLVEAGPVGVR